MFSIQLEPAASATQPQGTDGSSQTADNAEQAGQSPFARLFQQLHPAATATLASPEITKPPLPSNVERQLVAASEDATDPLGALVAWTISPQLQVITPAAETPSTGSLQAFAKAQGLDEETVQWLFTQPPPSSQTVAGDAFSTNSANDTTLIDAKTSPANLTPANLTPANTTNAEGVSTIPADEVPSISKLKPEPKWQPAQAAAGLSPNATSPGKDGAYNVPLGKAGLLMSSDNSLTRMAQPLQPEAQTQDNTQLPLGPTPIALRTGQSSGLKIMSETATTDLASPGELSHSEQTLAAMAIAVSTRPTAMRTFAAKPASDGLLNANTPPEVVVLTIDLEDPSSSDKTEPERPDQPSSTPLGQPGFMAAGDSLAKRGLTLSAHDTGTADPLLDADPWAQSDKVSTLSQRLGEAIGERLVAAMERGQWQLKLMLKPAHLGHIEVDMRMRNGELDASFTAQQALTRELLQEGMARLKSALNNVGMDVAHVQVGDGQNRRFGENPTPDQSARRTEVPVSKDNQASASNSAPVRQDRYGADGLDVMV